MVNEDLERLIQTGEIVRYEFEDTGWTESVKITFPSGLVLTISSCIFANSSGLIVETW